jgi:hypothetical protein
VDSASRQRAQVPHRPANRQDHGRRYYTWAELLRRVYGDPCRLLRATKNSFSARSPIDS